MTSNDSFIQLAQKACQATLRGDSVQVAQFLGDTRRIVSRMDARLLSPSDTCEELLQRLSSEDPIPKCSADHVLRALLLIPPCYETPWRAIIKLIECLHVQSGWLGSSPNALFAGIADARAFLQQTISSWWRQESTIVGFQLSSSSFKSTPQNWLMRIAQLAIKPLQDEKAAVTTSDNRHWILPLDLVGVIICFCQELEGPQSTTRTSILDQLFSETFLKLRILPILSLANDLKSQLREGDWQRLHTLLNEALSSKQIILSDFPGVARSIISLSDQNQEWKQHLLHVLHASSVDLSTYSTVEAVIEFNLATQSTQMLYEWHCVESTTSVKKWVLANYYLLVFSSARRAGSRLVSRFLSRALGNDHNTFNIFDLCTQLLAELCLPSATKVRRKFSIAQLQQLLDGVRYDGEGKFSRNKQSIKELEMAVLNQSLYLGSTKFENRRQCLSAAGRAQEWIHVATVLLSKPNLSDRLTAILIIVAVFCEVPASRSTLVRSMVGDGKSLQNEDCIVIGLLVRSLNDQTDLAALEPIFTYYSSKNLRFDIFIQLADAFSVVDSGRGAILSLCEKNLYASNAQWWDVIENRGSTERRDMLQSSLYGLCILLVEWDHVGWSAWRLLSDFIVLNKPALPVIIRRWLYRKLSSLNRSDRLSKATMEHLLRALLTRLLSYFDWVGGIITFIPQRAVAQFGASTASILREDLSLLFELVIEFTLKVSSSRGVSNVDLEKCRLNLQVIGRNSIHHNFEVGSEPLYHRVLAALLASSLLLVHSKANGKHTTGLSSSIASSRNEMVKSIAKDEKDTFGPGECLPDWLSGRTDSKACGDVEPSQCFYESLCNLIVEFLSKQFQPPRSESQTAFAMSLSSVYITKRKMSCLKHKSAFDLPTIVQNVAPVTVCTFSETIPMMLADETTKLEDLDAILLGVQSVCDAVTSQARASIENEEWSGDMMMLLGEVSRLHHRVTSERPTVELFRFLESACSEREQTIQGTKGFLSIRNGADADVVIREFRAKILRALVTCIAAISRGPIFEAANNKGFFGQRTQHQKIEVEGLANFASKMLDSTTKDLLHGMNEHSGGIVGTVYDLYLELIEALSTLSTRLIALSFNEQNGADVINAALYRMTEILHKYPILKLSLFKRTLHIAIVVLPSLRRVALRHSSVVTAEAKDSGEFFANLSTQILEIVERKAMGESIEWTDSPKTPQIVNGKDDDGRLENSDGKRLEDNDAIPLEISIPAGTASRSTQHDCKNVILISEASFGYTVHALLVAIEAEFNESVIALQQKVSPNQNADTLSLDIGYLVRRRQGLHHCMVVICRCLESAAKTSEVATENKSVLAQSLPDGSKLQFLVGVDRLTLILVRSFRLLTLYFQRGNCSTSSLEEVICIVAAWVSDDTLDLIAGSRRWFQAENISAESRKAGQREVDKVLSRLPKLMCRIDELENMLQRLVDNVVSWRMKDSIQHKRWQKVEDFMKRSIMNEGSRGDFSLERGAKRQFDAAAGTRSRGYDNATGERKRKAHQANLAKRMRRERKRPVPRSRNQVVDQWLHIDQDHVDEDDDDAFVDLEDFLVDG